MSPRVWYAAEPNCGCVTACATAETFDGQPVSLAQAQRDFLGMGIFERASDRRTWEKADFTPAMRARIRECTHQDGGQS